MPPAICSSRHLFCFTSLSVTKFASDQQVHERNTNAKLRCTILRVEKCAWRIHSIGPSKANVMMTVGNF